jgi:hypothetical protein
MLTIPSTLALICLTLAERHALTSVFAVLRPQDTLSAGFLRLVTLPQYRLEYC